MTYANKLIYGIPTYNLGGIFYHGFSIFFHMYVNAVILLFSSYHDCPYISRNMKSLDIGGIVNQ